ncbi:MAG: hypothetical protein IIY71_04250 [Oscillospiraceae bacterium]|nr:hypothetical protein [Oscillospiraceae bacterium]
MKKQSSAAKRDEMIFNKILIMFLVAFVAEVICLVLNRLYLYAGTFMTAHTIVRVISYVSIAVAVLGIILFITRLKREKASLGAFLFLAGAAGWVACQWMEYFYPHGAKYLCYLIPVILVLGLIYYIYPRDCFASVVLGTVVLLVLWTARRAWGNVNRMGTLWVLAAVAAVVLAVCGLLAWRLSKSDGMAKLFGRSYRVLSKKAKYPLLYATCILGIAALLAAMLLGPVAAYFLLFLLGAYLIILIVYYTTKLM